MDVLGLKVVLKVCKRSLMRCDRVLDLGKNKTGAMVGLIGRNAVEAEGQLTKEDGCRPLEAEGDDRPRVVHSYKHNHDSGRTAATAGQQASETDGTRKYTHSCSQCGQQRPAEAHSFGNSRVVVLLRPCVPSRNPGTHR